MQEAIRRPLTTNERLDNIESWHKRNANHLVDMKDEINKRFDKVDQRLETIEQLLRDINSRV